MSRTGILFGSSTGNTENIARKLAEKLENSELLNVAAIAADEVEKYDNLILGTSTWGFGDWEVFLPKLTTKNLKGKTVAFFGLGDTSAYPETFVDAMGLIYQELKNKEIELVGTVSTSDYSFDDSKAILNDEFIGLAIDEDSESDRTDERINKWIAAISPKLK